MSIKSYIRVEVVLECNGDPACDLDYVVGTVEEDLEGLFWQGDIFVKSSSIKTIGELEGGVDEDGR